MPARLSVPIPKGLRSRCSSARNNYGDARYLSHVKSFFTTISIENSRAYDVPYRSWNGSRHALAHLARPELCRSQGSRPVVRLPQIRCFYGSLPLQREAVDHYETLGLTPDATQAEIKTTFYRLSKLHHPDRNPDDPTASSRFQRISSAYSVLGTPSKRTQYDRDSGYVSAYAESSGGGAAYSGSFSSAQRGRSTGPYGARPASGLNKRRGTFRGPPPSFYASGGWGAQSNKRRAAQQEGTTAGYRGEANTSGSAGTNGSEGYAGHHGSAYGSGGATWGQGMVGDNVPHFDRQSHYERQEEMDERMAKRRRARRVMEQREAEVLQRDWTVRFVLVALVVGLGVTVDALYVRPARQGGESRRDRGK